MAESKSQIPHYYVSINVDMTDALAFRKQVNRRSRIRSSRFGQRSDRKSRCPRPARAPDVNTSWVDGELYQRDSIDINTPSPLMAG